MANNKKGFNYFAQSALNKINEETQTPTQQIKKASEKQDDPINDVIEEAPTPTIKKGSINTNTTRFNFELDKDVKYQLNLYASIKKISLKNLCTQIFKDFIMTIDEADKKQMDQMASILPKDYFDRKY